MVHDHYTAQADNPGASLSGPSSNGSSNGASPNGRHIHLEHELQQYIDAGYALTPIAPGEKSPIFKDWPHQDFSLAELRLLFAKQPYNIGVRLGDASGDLVDVDLNSPEALAIAD